MPLPPRAVLKANVLLTTVRVWEIEAGADLQGAVNKVDRPDGKDDGVGFAAGLSGVNDGRAKVGSGPVNLSFPRGREVREADRFAPTQNNDRGRTLRQHPVLKRLQLESGPRSPTRT